MNPTASRVPLILQGSFPHRLPYDPMHQLHPLLTVHDVVGLTVTLSRPLLLLPRQDHLDPVIVGLRVVLPHMEQEPLEPGGLLRRRAER